MAIPLLLYPRIAQSFTLALAFMGNPLPVI